MKPRLKLKSEYNCASSLMKSYQSTPMEIDAMDTTLNPEAIQVIIINAIYANVSENVYDRVLT